MDFVHQAIQPVGSILKNQRCTNFPSKESKGPQVWLVYIKKGPGQVRTDLLVSCELIDLQFPSTGSDIFKYSFCVNRTKHTPPWKWDTFSLAHQ